MGAIVPIARGLAGSGVLFDLLFAPLRKGEGARIGIVGDSGCGKTEAAKRLLDEWLRRVARGFAFVVDDTGPSQFRGQLRGFVADLAHHPLVPTGPRVAVFRGRDGVHVDTETVGQLAWRAVGRVPPVPTLVLLDELERSANAGHWRHGRDCPGRDVPTDCSCKLPKLWSWGRRSCASVIFTTQSPQAAPRSAFEQSSALLCVHLGGRGLKYLRGLDYVDSAAELAIGKLPDAIAVAQGAVPPYVLLRRGASWDGRLYRL